jgi:pyruvate dehydrogenase E1 component alpha subunit
MMHNHKINIDFVRLLNEQGTVEGEFPPYLNKRPTLISLYQTMLIARLFDTAAVNLQRTGKIGTYASCRGQEAIGAGIGYHLKSGDVFIPYYRDIATQIQRGVLLYEILQYWAGDERGSCYSQQTKDYPLCVPIATQLCHATGVAYALKQQQKSNVAVVTCGDGATSKGDFYEAINIAGALNLPVLFIVNNNQWAISVPRERQSAAQTLAQKGIAAGLDVIQVDGNDALAVSHVVKGALSSIRKTNKPYFIEAITYRLCDHTTADDATRYMSVKERENAEKNEPLIRLKKFLESKHQWSTAEDKALQKSCQSTIETAVEAFELIKPQSPGDFFNYMYEKLPADLEEQKHDFLEWYKHHG